VKKWLLVGVGAVVVLALAGTAVYAMVFRAAPLPTAQQPRPPQTATVVSTDLANTVTVNGTLGYGATTMLTGRKAGTLTWLPTVGTVVGRGQRLYAVDAKPVMLFLGDTPLYRQLDSTATPGPDLSEVNANLRALGYHGAPTGNTYTTGTTNALKQWQKRVGLDETGTLGIGDVIVLPAAVRVDSLKAQAGAAAAADIAGLTSTTKMVTASADPSQIDSSLLKPGGKVALSLPNGKQTTGTIASLGPAAGGAGESGAAGGAGQGQTNQVAATITFDDQSATSGVDSGTVGVTVTAESHNGVLAVPVGALVAVQGGGYGVQVVTGSTTTLIGVRTGMYADGLVEVSGQGIAAGQKVVTVS
jgi:Putative peptidoglycan binding domain